MLINFARFMPSAFLVHANATNTQFASYAPAQALVYDRELEKIAQKRCLSLRGWSHEGVDDDVFYPMKKKGYYFVGENLARANNQFPHMYVPYYHIRELENSYTHYQNNHNNLYSKIGIAQCSNTKVDQQTGVVNVTTVYVFAGKINY